MKHIPISKDTWRKLNELKREYHLHNYDKVIMALYNEVIRLQSDNSNE